jgi:DNA-directed RNA polymerase specialized sigma subunit
MKRSARKPGEAVISNEMKATVQRLKAEGKTQDEIAARVRVSQTTVSRILRGVR